MNNCIIQLEVDHCAKSGCGGPSVTNVGVFKNKRHAKRFMRSDKDFRKIFKGTKLNIFIIPSPINGPIKTLHIEEIKADLKEKTFNLVRAIPKDINIKNIAV